MSTKTIPKIISRGLHNILTQKLNDGHTGYGSAVSKWQGDTSLKFTPSREVTVLPSGNNPAWDTIEGPVVGDLEITFYSLPLDAMPDLLSVEYDAEEGVCVGEVNSSTYSGISFDTLVTKEGVPSTNKLIIYKTRFNLPEVDVKTVAEGDNAVANVTLKGKVYPVFFQKENGTQGHRTYCVVNSVSNKAKFDANADLIVFPGVGE